MLTMVAYLGVTQMFQLKVGKIVTYLPAWKYMVSIYTTSHSSLNISSSQKVFFKTPPFLFVITGKQNNNTRVSFALPTIMRILRDMFKNSDFKSKFHFRRGMFEKEGISVNELQLDW